MSYSKFKQYGKRFSEHYWGDYIHNIWLRYFEKHGSDLFQEKKSNRFIYLTVKNEFINSMYHNDKFESMLRPEVSEVGEEYLAEFLPSTDPSPLDILVYNELDHFFKQKIYKYILLKNLKSKSYNHEKQNEKYIAVYELLKFGYTTTDIANELGVSEQQINYYKNQIREAIKMGTWVNPFNGSKTKVTRAITQKQWESKKYDHNDYDLESDNEFYSLFVHKESGEGLLVRSSEERDMSFLVNY